MSYNDEPDHHRDEDLTISRALSYNNSHVAQASTSIAPSGLKQALASERPVAAAPASRRRHVVIPDPVAFRYAALPSA